MGNLVKTVEMRILASAGDAQAQLDELTAKADKLDGDAIRMRFRLDDAEGKAQLDAIKARADELGFKDVSIKVRVDGAGRAIADLMAVKHEEDAAAEGGLLDKLLGGGPPLSGGESAGGGIPILGSLFGPAGLAIVPAIGAALVEITGLVSGISAAGAGAVAFGALAYPAVKKVETAYSGLNAAQQAYNQAQAKEAASPSKANATAEANALANLKAQQKLLSEMSPSERGAVTGIQQLVAEFGKMSRAFEPTAFKVFSDALKGIAGLLPAVTPFANTFAKSLDGLLQQFGKFTASKGFGDFLKQFQSVEGPAVTAIGEGIGKVATSFGKLITTMSGKDVAQTIGIAFNTVAGILSGLASIVAHLMSNWDQMSSAAKHTATDVAGAFKTMASGIETAWATAFAFIQAIPGKIKGVFAGAGGWLLAAGEAIMGGLFAGIRTGWDKITSFVGGIGSWIAAHKGPISADAVLLVPHGRAIMAGLIAGMDSQLVALRMAAAHAAAAITAEIKTEVAYAKSVAASAVSGLSLTSINLTTDTVTSGMQTYLAALKSFTADIKALSGQHLNKTLMQQLITAGPVTGDQYAQSILQSGSTGQVNALYKQITQQSATLGAQAAMAIYGNKVSPAAGGNFTVTVNVTAPAGKTGQELGQAQGQALALEIIKVLKEYKRHGGGAPLGIA